jgi:hypothetical protein
VLADTIFGGFIGAAADAADQLLTTGTVDPFSAAIGGAAGALGGRAAFEAGAAGFTVAQAAGLGV